MSKANKEQPTFADILELAIANAVSAKENRISAEETRITAETSLKFAEENRKSLDNLKQLAIMHEKDRQVIWEGLEVIATENNRILNNHEKLLSEIKAMRRDQQKLIDTLLYKDIL